MANLNDVWNWPNNSANGYATDSADWSGDASHGIDQRVNNIRTYAYKVHNTGSLHFTNDLSRTTDELNEAFAKYKHYANHYSDDTNPTFNKLAKYPMVEWNIQPNGRSIAGIHYELNSNNMPRIRVQFTHAHEFGNGEQIEFFGFDTDTNGAQHREFNTIQPYVEIIDGFNVVLYEDSALTKLQQLDNNFFAQTDVFFTMLDDGTGSQDAVVHFDGFQETFSDGDVLQVADTFNNLTGTVAASSGTLLYLEKISGSNSFFLYTDSGRTTHATITSGQGKDKFATPATDGIPFSIASSGSAAAIAVDISDSSFNSLRTNIESQNMTPNTNTEDETNIFRGFCRVQITAGTGTSKAIPSSMDDTAFFGYKYTKSTGNLEILTDPTGTFGSRDSNVLTATNASGNITGNIKIIDFWSHRTESPGSFGTGTSKQTQIVPASGANIGGLFFTGQINETGLQPVSPLSHPLASEAGTLYSGTKSSNDDNQNFAQVIYQLESATYTNPGRRKYQYNIANGTLANGAVYDFTKFWKPGATNSVSPSYQTTPTATPVLTSAGYLNGSDNLGAFPARGLFTLAQLGVSDRLTGSPAKPEARVIPKVGIFEINAQANASPGTKSGFILVIANSIASFAYAEDQFDTDDEWIDPDFAEGAKVWPKDPVPSAIKFTVTQPTSVTRSQSGIKYTRASGVVRHQMEVEYPPMTYDQFREFEVVAQAAQGQVIPFYFDIKNYTKRHGGSTNLFYQRTDSANSSITTSHLRAAESTTAGQKVITVEGFINDEADCFIRGETLIGPPNGNGSLYYVLNDNIRSNKYGEAKIRVPYGVTKDRDANISFYKNPTHIIVTLSEDSFEYTLGTDGFYRVSFRFDFDEYK
jgi:hypothetical protein